MTTPSSSTKDPVFDLYSRPEYFQDLIDRAAKLTKGDAITLMTMDYDPFVPLIGQLTDELCAAALRGVSVELFVDSMDFILDKNSLPGPLMFGKPLNSLGYGHSRYIHNQLERLRENGGRYTITNKPSRAFINPVSGRSHIKLALINNRVYLGGCNLDDQSRIDMMTAWEDAETAAWLRDLTVKIRASGNVCKALEGADLTHIVGPGVTIYVDSGIKRQSLIYEKALDFIDTANDSVYITCQFFPGGPTAQHLLAAQKRGVSIDIIFSGPSAHKHAIGHHVYNAREHSRLPANFFKGQLPKSSPKLHAKLIATEHGAMIGSHNYLDIGVNLGTAEIALVNLSHDFAVRAKQKIANIIRQKSN